MKQKTILITGSTGFIGQYLTSKLNKEYNIIGIDINNIYPNNHSNYYNYNIVDLNKIKKLFETYKINYIIHTAAVKDINWCENNKKEAKKINLTATINLINLAQKYNSKFIYISSDQVFNGSLKNSQETTPKNPINYYGVLKNEVENILINIKNSAICRTGMVFGNIPKNQKEEFNKVKKDDKLRVQGYIIQHVISRLANNQTIILPKDEFCNPTSNYLLYKQINIILKNNLSGIFHLCGAERISRYEFGKKIAKKFNLNYKLIDPLNYHNPLRPKDVSMDITKSQHRLKIKFDKISDMITQVYEEGKNESLYRICATN